MNVPPLLSPVFFIFFSAILLASSRKASRGFFFSVIFDEAGNGGGFAALAPRAWVAGNEGAAADDAAPFSHESSSDFLDFGGGLESTHPFCPRRFTCTPSSRLLGTMRLRDKELGFQLDDAAHCQEYGERRRKKETAMTAAKGLEAGQHYPPRPPGEESQRTPRRAAR
eukprot:CAMPEP_0185261004 /NCGR_PEP_ID=MMETSP1359-20130426/9496_1 /TAXON_ID=552665 /ORGANISM="Bigelowiella longifila, Strain CCMP242" /LENGTH=167 /DNA_ID=CAMNT_0027847479 /DNA_START=438 /DNA_END=942 /DNA_ORIENTATION=+